MDPVINAVDNEGKHRERSFENFQNIMLLMVEVDVFTKSQIIVILKREI